MPNSLAHLVVYLSPLIVVILFRRLSLPQALIWSILGTYLFLPERVNLNLPVLPNLDKFSLPALTALVMCWLALRKERRQPVRTLPAAGAVEDGKPERPHAASSSPIRREPRRIKRRGGRIMILLVALCLMAPIMTWFTNRSPTVSGGATLQAMVLYDALSMVQSTFIMLLPFLLARRVLNTPETHREILKALVYAGLAYSLLILIEVRLSPQLNKWIYGFYSHSFAQHIRDGGFRPMVFIKHGLRVGIFMSMAVLAALALYRMRDGNRPVRWLWAGGWLFGVLFLSKTLGAFLITLLLAPMILFFGLRLRLAAAALLAATVLFYPMLRGAGVVPVDRITAAVATISEARAGSLEFRLGNEEALLERASLKPVFGWGGWNRSRIFDEKGRYDSVTDGTWIIIIGERGWVGYLTFFGLLCLPPILLFLRSRQLAIEGATVGLVLVLAANLVDLIPNSGLVPVTWLVAGALAGRYQLGVLPHSDAEAPRGAGRHRATSVREAPPARKRPPPPGRRPLRPAPQA